MTSRSIEMWTGFLEIFTWSKVLAVVLIGQRAQKVQSVAIGLDIQLVLGKLHFPDLKAGERKGPDGR